MDVYSADQIQIENVDRKRSWEQEYHVEDKNSCLTFWKKAQDNSAR